MKNENRYSKAGSEQVPLRIGQGPSQKIVATIGKLPGLDREERVVWEEINRILAGKLLICPCKKPVQLLYETLDREKGL